MGKREDDRAYYERNREKVKARNLARYYADKERILAQQRARYEETRETVLARNRAWAEANPEKMRAYHRAYVARNRELWSAQTAAYRAAKKSATPSWVSRSDLLRVYRAARAAQVATGVPHHVDHIVPLQSNIVCGLHVPWNLSPLPGRANRAKGNRYWPGMP